MRWAYNHAASAGSCRPPAATRRGTPARTTDLFGGDCSCARTRGNCCYWSLLVLAPGVAYAQSSIAGVVRDTSGAVLPGVTVEAASDVLIEKVRSAVTDGNGLYRIVDLRPGTYTVTFTLPGFKTYKRDGLVLAAEFNATVNADMAVGASRGNDHGHRREPDRGRAERQAAAHARQRSGAGAAHRQGLRRRDGAHPVDGAERRRRAERAAQPRHGGVRRPRRPRQRRPRAGRRLEHGRLAERRRRLGLPAGRRERGRRSPSRRPAAWAKPRLAARPSTSCRAPAATPSARTSSSPGCAAACSRATTPTS